MRSTRPRLVLGLSTTFSNAWVVRWRWSCFHWDFHTDGMLRSRINDHRIEFES